MANEIQRMEMGKTYMIKTKKYHGSFLAIGAKNRVLPLFLAAKHTQLTSDSGVQIFWSRKNKNPSEEDSEGKFDFVYRKKVQKAKVNWFMIRKTPKTLKILQDFEDKGLIVSKRIKGEYKVTVNDILQVDKIKRRLEYKQKEEDNIEVFQINVFGEKSLSSDFVYIGIYSLHSETEVSLAYSFKTNYCKATLSGEDGINDLAVAKNIESEEDDLCQLEHKPTEQCNNCMLCSGQRNEKFKDEIKKYITSIIHDQKKFAEFKDEVLEIQTRIAEKRQEFLNEKEQNKV